MPISKKLIKFLQENKVSFEVIKHRTVYTAYDKAQTLKVPEKAIGKTLLLKIDKKFALVLIPANKNLDKNKFKKIAKSRKLKFVSEKLMKNKFRGVKVGAIPPFGNLWGLSSFVDRAVVNQPKIIINGGDYNFSIRLKSNALKKIIPDLVVGNFSQTKPGSRILTGSAKSRTK